MSARRFHPGLLEEAARDLDRHLRSLSTAETHRPSYLKNHKAHLDFMGRLVSGGVEIRGRFTWLKRLVRRPLRPYLFHQSQIDRMAVERLAAVHDEIEQLRLNLEGLREEFRDELEYLESRTRGRSLAAAPDGPVARPSLALHTVPDGARLLIGRVPVPRPGFLRIDPEGDASDLDAPPHGIPARPGSTAEIVAANVLEQYPADEVREVLLPHWAGLLRPGGTLTVIADDFGAAADRLRDGLIDAEGLAEALFGDGKPRRSAYTPEAVRRLLDGAGLVNVSVDERVQRPDAGAYGFSVSAAAPAA